MAVKTDGETEIAKLPTPDSPLHHPGVTPACQVRISSPTRLRRTRKETQMPLSRLFPDMPASSGYIIPPNTPLGWVVGGLADGRAARRVLCNTGGLASLATRTWPCASQTKQLYLLLPSTRIACRPSRQHTGQQELLTVDHPLGI